MARFIALLAHGPIIESEWLDADTVDAILWSSAAEEAAARFGDDDNLDITPTLKIALRDVTTGETRVYDVEVSLCYDAQWDRNARIPQGVINAPV